jgi:hypothetical protein
MELDRVDCIELSDPAQHGVIFVFKEMGKEVPFHILFDLGISPEQLAAGLRDSASMIDDAA